MVGSSFDEQIVALLADGKSAYSILQISRLLKKSYPHVYNVVQQLIKEDVLHKLVVGNTHLCAINLDSDKAVNILAQHQIGKRKDFNKNMGNLLKEVKAKKSQYRITTAFFARQTLYIVIEDKSLLKEAKRCFQGATVIDNSGCAELLVERNLHKLAVVLLGFESYYEILRGVLDRLPGPLEFVR